MGSDDVVTVGPAPAPARASGTRRSPLLYRIAAVAVWAPVFALWTTTGPLPYVRGLLFVLLGACALVLTTVAAHGWDVAAFRAMPSWEAAARAAWTTGALGTVVFFESTLVGPSEGLAATATGLALSFVPSLAGLVLAAGLLARMMRVTPGDRSATLRKRLPGSAWDLWIGRALFAALVTWPILQARVTAAGPGIADSVWMLHWPAVLVLLGVVVALGLLGGAPLRERAASAALAGAGTLTALSGLVQALLGVARADIAAVSAGMSFLVTAVFTTLLGLALVTYPRDDRRAAEPNRAPFAARIAWVLFPLLTIGLMAVMFLMTLTPMTRRP